MKRQLTGHVVTRWYRAPELILLEKDYGQAIDMWSVGCIFAELATNSPLFKGENEQTQLMQIFRQMGKPNEETWPGITQNSKFSAVQWPNHDPYNLRDLIQEDQIDDQGMDLLKKMLEYEPSRRITAKQALQHPYFSY